MSLDALRQMFFEEAKENLEIAEASLLKLEKDPGSFSVLNEVFRVIHTVKGNSGTFGFPSITEIAHSMETRLETARDGSRPLTAPCLQQLFEQLDALNAEVRSLASGSPVRAELSAHEVEDKTESPEIEPAEPQLPEVEPPRAEPAQAQEPPTSGHWLLNVYPNADFYEKGNDIVLILASLGTPIETRLDWSTLPDLQEMDPVRSYLNWSLCLPPHLRENELKEPFLWAEDDCRIEMIRKGAEPAPATAHLPATVRVEKPEEPNEQQPATGIPRAASTGKEAQDGQVLKIPIERLDRLVNQIAELSIAQSLFLRGADPLDPTVERLQQALWSVQETVLDVRMQPIKYVFQRLPRLVRTLARDLSKKVELVMEGEETELDKVLLDSLVDPLVHLMRNAIDHGLESPEERSLLGKPAQGLVKVSASYRGGRVMVEVCDDGAGIDPEKLRQKAITLGWISEGEALSEEDVYDFLFQPGFSTASAVSSISGRGVGLDVVKQNLTVLGGSIAVQSVLGKSTVFQLSLPLTLAMLDVQKVTAGDFTFYIPLDVIIECLAWDERRLKEIGQEYFYSFREHFIRVERLDRLLGYPCDRSLEGSILMVVESSSGLAGFIVDEILQQERVVVKSLEKNFRHVRGVLGAAVSNEGRVVPILDAFGCFEKYRKRLRPA